MPRDRERLNVLTRTSSRPKCFARLAANIHAQTYPNLNWIVGSDTPADLAYIKKGKPDQTFTYRNLQHQFAYGGYGVPTRYPYNSYLNWLGVQVKEGWIMYLDDDDMFTRPDAAETIIQMADDPERLVLWQVQIGGVTYPGSVPAKPQAGHVSGIGFAFHVSHRAEVNWPPEMGGDAAVIKHLYKLLQPVWIADVLTKAQGGHGRGKRKDF